jgi:biotin carboxyl carrier protein
MLAMQNNDNKENGKPEFKSFIFEETKYKTLLTKKFEKRTPWLKPDEKKVFSFLPGTVKSTVKKGDKIEKGQVILVFEAMKMMNSVKSNISGKVKNVLVKPGDKFPKNQLLLEFE